MKKYKLLYFVSEDEYFLTHKMSQAKSALKLAHNAKNPSKVKACVLRKWPQLKKD